MNAGSGVVRAPSRAQFWFFTALFLNIVFVLFGLSIVSHSRGLSVFNALIGLFLLAVILWARFSNEYVLYPLHVGLLFLFLLGLYASYKDMFVAIAWLDTVLHFFAGLFVALYALSLTHHQVYDFWALILWGVAIAVLVGVLWEFAEYFGNLLLENPTYVLSVTDLLGDLGADLLGALVASLPFAWLVRPPRKMYSSGHNI